MASSNSLITVFLLLLYKSGETSADIIFSSQPMNQTVCEGDSAVFNCTYSGTNSVPNWNIDDDQYSRFVSHEYAYANGMLTLVNANLKDDGTRYQCVFPTASSTIGILHVTTSISDITYNNGCLCLHFNPQCSIEMYNIYVTDITDFETPLTDTYLYNNNSHDSCLPLSFDHYPDVCGPFQVNVTATNTEGTSYQTSQLINTTNDLSVNVCDCYWRKDQVNKTNVLVMIGASTVSVELFCGIGINDALNFTLLQNRSDIRNITMICNQITSVPNLKSNVEYSIVRRYENLNCTLVNFKLPSSSNSSTTTTPITIIIYLFFFLFFCNN